MAETKPKPSPSAAHDGKKKVGRGRVFLLAAVAVVAFVLLRRKLSGQAAASVPAVVASDPAVTGSAAGGDTGANGAGGSSSADLLGAQIDYLSAYADSLAGRLSNVEALQGSGAPLKNFATNDPIGGGIQAPAPAAPAPAAPAPAAATPQPVVTAPAATPAPLTPAQVEGHNEFLAKQAAQTASGGTHTAGF
jgi:hypothetical protein